MTLSSTTRSQNPLSRSEGASGAPRRATTLPSTVPLPSSEFRPRPARRSSAPGAISQASIYIALYDTLQTRWGKRAEDMEVRAEWDRIVEASEAERPMKALKSEGDFSPAGKRERDEDVDTEDGHAKKAKLADSAAEVSHPSESVTTADSSTTTQSPAPPTSFPSDAEARQRRSSSIPISHPRALRPLKSSLERTDSLLAVVRSFESMLGQRREMWRDVERMRAGQATLRASIYIISSPCSLLPRNLR